MKRIQNLDFLASQFLKQSGLIKVPENTIKEVSDYIISAYCANILNKLNPFIEAVQARAKMVNTLHNNLIMWEDSLNLITKVLSTQDPKDLAILDKACIDRKFPTIPYISMAEDSETRMVGLIDKTKSGLSFECMSDNDNYWCSLKINLPEDPEGKNYYTFKSEEINLTQKEAINWLHTINDQLTEGFNLFRGAISNFDIYSSSYIKNLILTKGVLIRNSKSSSSSLFSRTFSIKEEDLPYWYLSLPKSIKSLSFNVHFVPSKEGAKVIHESEGWEGLWVKTDINRFPGYIGDLYIHKDIENELEIIKKYRSNNISELNNIFINIKDTVRHELQHMIQSFIQQLSSAKPVSHLKKELRDPRYDQHGDLVLTKSPNTRQIHSLREIEFHTDLTDSIEDFLKYKTNLPKELHPFYAKAWVLDITPSRFETIAHDYQLAIEKSKNIYNTPEQISNIRTAVNALNSANFFFRDLKKALEIEKDKKYQQIYQNRYNRAVSEFMKTIQI